MAIPSGEVDQLQILKMLREILARIEEMEERIRIIEERTRGPSLKAVRRGLRKRTEKQD